MRTITVLCAASNEPITIKVKKLNQWSAIDLENIQCIKIYNKWHIGYMKFDKWILGKKTFKPMIEIPNEFATRKEATQYLINSFKK